MAAAPTLIRATISTLMVLAWPAATRPSTCPPLHTWTGESPGDFFGVQLADVGDLNGDGWSELCIGAAELGADSTGHCDIYSGQDLTLLFSISGEGNGDFFGSGAVGGDLNGDGYSDLIISAALYDAGPLPDAGRVYIFYGGPGPWASERTATEADTTLDGEQAFDELGGERALAIIEDVDGDSCADLAVGAASFISGFYPGKVYVYSGCTLDTLYTLSGENYADRFGLSLRSGGDVNGDGSTDLIVGAPHYGRNNGLGVGHVYVFTAATGQLIAHFMSGDFGDAFGWGIDGVGDVNQDGYDDIVVGAHHWPYDGARHDTGRAYVFLGRDAFPDTAYSDSAALLLQGEFDFANFGGTIKGLGDINQDGHDDFAITAYAFLTDHPRPGWAHIYSGIDGAELYRMTDDIVRGRFGYGLVNAMDQDQDGVLDLWIGAFSSNGAGQVYCYLIGDTDQDSIAAGCDNCAAAYNPAQEDADTDGYGDICDNCAAVANPDQDVTITMTGDVNRDGVITSADIIFEVNYVFKGGPKPMPCEAAGDVTCERVVTSSDIIYLVNYVFKGGPAPCDVCQAMGIGWSCP